MALSEHAAIVVQAEPVEGTGLNLTRNIGSGKNGHRGEWVTAMTFLLTIQWPGLLAGCPLLPPAVAAAGVTGQAGIDTVTTDTDK